MLCSVFCVRQIVLLLIIYEFSGVMDYVCIFLFRPGGGGRRRRSDSTFSTSGCIYRGVTVVFHSQTLCFLESQYIELLLYEAGFFGIVGLVSLLDFPSECASVCSEER